MTIEKPCPDCKGSGKIMLTLPLLGEKVETSCKRCRGTGRIPADKE